MIARLSVLVLVFVALCMSPACAEPPAPPAPLVARADVAPSPRALADVVIVEPSRLRVPSSARHHLSNVEVGAVVVGLPSRTHPEDNPLGYLRRVRSIDEGAHETVLTTDPASLNDLFEQGSLDVTLVDERAGARARAIEPRRFASASGTLRARSLEGELDGELDVAIPATTLGDVKDLLPGGSKLPGGANASGALKLDGGHARVRPYIRLKTDFGVLSIESFSAEMGLDYDVELALTASAKLAASRPIQLKGTALTREIVPWRHLAAGVLPTVPIPVPWTVKARVVASCTWSSAGAVTVTATGRIEGNPHVKVIYTAEAGWSYEGNPVDAHPSGDVTVDLEGGLGLSCGVTPEIGVFIADVAGPYVRGGPYVNVTGASSADCPPPGADVKVTPGMKVTFGAAVTILGLFTSSATVFEEDLWGEPIAELGEACGGEQKAEPCSGQPDGYHCGADIQGDPGAQYLCLEGVTKGQAPCPNACRITGDDVLCE